jgi:2-oxoisovalerate dehydrogenase E2 component (dihydrolipoyl transacylase)
LSEATFLLPDVGEGLTEAEIVEWKVQVGDVVTLNQALVDIETAKAVVELPSPYAGTVVTLHGNVGDVIEVHQPLITFDLGGDATAPVATAGAAQSAQEPAVGEGRQAVLIGYGVANEEAVVTRQHRRAGTTSAAGTVPPQRRHRHRRSRRSPSARRWPRARRRPCASTRSSTAWISPRLRGRGATASSPATTSTTPCRDREADVLVPR